MRFLPVFLGLTVLATLITVVFLDEPLARFINTLTWTRAAHNPALGFPVLILLACILVPVGAAANWSSQSWRGIVEPLVVASFSLTWSVAINDFLLKFVFGRPTPDDFMATGSDRFHWLHGVPTDSFPSGHAVQIASIGYVFVLLFPRYRVAWFGLMAAGLSALVLGNWHFLGDVIAGAAFGGVGAVTTLSLWRFRQNSAIERACDLKD